MEKGSSYLPMLFLLDFGRGYLHAITILQRELRRLARRVASHAAGPVSETIIFPIGSDSDGKNGCKRGTVGLQRIYETDPWLK